MVWYWNVCFELWTKLAFLSASIANQEHVFVYQISKIDSNTLFPNWSMYLSLKLHQNYSSNLSKIAVMPPAISAIFILASGTFLGVNKRVILKLVIFTTDESILFYSILTTMKFLAYFHN